MPLHSPIRHYSLCWRLRNSAGQGCPTTFPSPNGFGNLAWALMTDWPCTCESVSECMCLCKYARVLCFCHVSGKLQMNDVWPCFFSFSSSFSWAFMLIGRLSHPDLFLFLFHSIHTQFLPIFLISLSLVLFLLLVSLCSWCPWFENKRHRP